MAPERPNIDLEPVSSGGSWLPVILFGGIVLVWMAAILQPILMAVLFGE